MMCGMALVEKVGLEEVREEVEEEGEEIEIPNTLW